MEGPAMKKIRMVMLFLFCAIFSLPFLSGGGEKCKALELWKPRGKTLRLDFNEARSGVKGIQGWLFQPKPFTPETRFSLVKDGNKRVLKVESRKSSGIILVDISRIPLQRYPILRWKWKAEKLPENADGRLPRKDDQALGIYVGAGKRVTNSLAFRWETSTPIGYRGNAKYGMGLINVKWESLRNNKDPLNVWVVEEINLYEKLMELFNGKLPRKDLALSISGNSQYTGSSSCGYVAFFEFAQKPSAKKNPK